MASLVDLNKAVDRYNKVVSINNKLAAKDPVYAVKITALRDDGLNSKVLAEVQRVRQATAGMGNATVVGGAVGVAAVAAISILYYISRREEQQLARDYPLQYAMQQVSSLAWIGVIGAVLIGGGIIYLEAKEPGTIPFLGGKKRKPTTGRKSSKRERDLERREWELEARERERRARREALRY